jgi:hypothetical protein
MDEKETERIAKAVDALTAKIGPSLHDQEHFVAAVALAGMAAHHVLHDGATEEDFLAVCRAAWKKSVQVHSSGCGGKH